MSPSRGRAESAILLSIIAAHLLVPAGLWFAARIGRPRFFGLGLYVAAAILFVDILLLLRESPVESAQQTVLDLRVPLILLVTSLGVAALDGPGIPLYIGIALLLLTVLYRTEPLADTSRFGVAELLLVSGAASLLIGSQVFSVPYYVNVPDTINHTTTAMVLLDSSHLSAISSSRYFSFSAFHVLSSTGMRFTRLSPRLFMGVFMLLLFQVALVAAYLFFTRVSGSKPLGIFAAILLSVNISYLHYGSIAHYQSLSYLFYSVFLTLLATGRWETRYVVLTVPIAVTWVVTHHVSVLIAVALTAVPIAYLAVYIWRTKRLWKERSTVYMFIAFGLIFSGYWVVVTSRFREVLSWIFFSSPAAEGVASSFYFIQAIDEIDELFRQSLPFFVDSLHYSFLLALALIGFLALARDGKFSSFRWRLVAVSFVPAAVFYFPNPAWVPLEGTIPFSRWRLMVLPFLLLVPAVGLRYGFQSARRRGIRHAAVAVFIVVLLFANTASGMVHPGFTDIVGIQKGSQQYLEEEELQASSFVYAHLNDRQQVYARSDLAVYLHQYAWAENRPHEESQFSKLSASYARKELLIEPGLSVVSVNAFNTNGIFVWLVDFESSTGSGAQVGSSIHADDYHWNQNQTATVYDNGNVVIEYRPS